MKKVLVVDGNSLLQIGFHGVKNVYNNNKHIGALYHFIVTLFVAIQINYFHL